MPDQSSSDDGIKGQTAGPVRLDLADFTFVHKVTALPLVWLHIQFVLLIDNVVEKPVISAPWQKPSSGCCLEMLRSVLEPGARLEQHRRHARTGCALAKGTGKQMYMCASCMSPTRTSPQSDAHDCRPDSNLLPKNFLDHILGASLLICNLHLCQTLLTRYTHCLLRFNQTL